MKKIYTTLCIILVLHAQTKKDIVTYAESVAKIYGIPEHIVPAIIQVESSYDLKAVSSLGAYGLMQITMSAYTDYTNMAHFPTYTNFTNIKKNWKANIDVGCWYLFNRCYKIKKDWKRAITAYFWGINHGSPTENYYNKVKKNITLRLTNN